MAERRLFFALWPDDRQRDTLRNTISPAARTVEGNAVPRGNWHVTLVFVGNFPEERVGELLTAAAAVSVEPFRLRFDRVCYWQRPKIACLQAMSVPSELATLVDDINKVTANFGIEPESATYRPHVTAVRKARPFEPIVLARPLELNWSEFALVESVSTREGVQYRPLKQ